MTHILIIARGSTHTQSDPPLVYIPMIYAYMLTYPGEQYPIRRHASATQIEDEQRRMLLNRASKRGTRSNVGRAFLPPPARSPSVQVASSFSKPNLSLSSTPVLRSPQPARPTSSSGLSTSCPNGNTPPSTAISTAASPAEQLSSKAPLTQGQGW